MFSIAAGFWKKAVGKNEQPIKVSKTTLDRIRAVNKVSGTILTFTATQISNVIKFGFDLGIQAKDELMATKKGQEISQNKYFIDTVNVGKGAIHVLGGVYGGLEQAFINVASGTKGMTESVLDYKYGKGVKDVFSEGAGVVGNVYLMGQAPAIGLQNEIYERSKGKNDKFNSRLASTWVNKAENKVNQKIEGMGYNAPQIDPNQKGRVFMDMEEDGRVGVKNSGMMRLNLGGKADNKVGGAGAGNGGQVDGSGYKKAPDQKWNWY